MQMLDGLDLADKSRSLPGAPYGLVPSIAQRLVTDFGLHPHPPGNLREEEIIKLLYNKFV